MGGPASVQGVAGTQTACSADADCQILADAMATCDEPDACQGMKPVMHCKDGACTFRTFIDADDACTEAIERDDCGRYESIFCSGEPEQDEVACATSCSDDDDCDEGAICADGDCIATESLRDGESCSDDDECKGGHCQNGYCCEHGDCCRTARQCPIEYRSEPQCSNPASCQGQRREPTCQRNTCGSEKVDDDSACTNVQVARRCPETENVVCTGDAEQPPPPECLEPEPDRSRDSSDPSPTPSPRPTPTPTPTPAPNPTPTPPAPEPEPEPRCGDGRVDSQEECEQRVSGVYNCSTECEKQTLYTLCAQGNGIDQGSCDNGFTCASEGVCLPRTLSGLAGCPEAPEGRSQTAFGNVCMLLCSSRADCPSHLTCRVVTDEERAAIPLPGYCVGRWDG
jgi:hypothetical protein